MYPPRRVDLTNDGQAGLVGALDQHPLGLVGVPGEGDYLHARVTLRCDRAEQAWGDWLVHAPESLDEAEPWHCE